MESKFFQDSSYNLQGQYVDESYLTAKRLAKRIIKQSTKVTEYRNFSAQLKEKQEVDKEA
ncbi:MAG: hypothetical protein VX344_03495 [Bacteroidota bacterium]|nr:hypothetical protein [Bacteroidota bacterium]